MKLATILTERRLKVWIKEPPENGGRLASEVNVTKNGFITIGEELLHHFDKYVSLLYNEDDGIFGLKPAIEVNRNAYIINRMRDRSSGSINAASFIAQLKIPCGRYKPLWSESEQAFLIRYKDWGV